MGDQIGGQPGWNGREQESNGHRHPGKRWLGPQSYDRDASGVREDLNVNSGEVLCSSSAWLCEEMPEISSLLPGTMVTPFTRGRLG